MAECRTTVFDELMEPVRLTVTTDEDDMEFDREDWRCFESAEGGPFPPLLPAAAETEAEVPCIIVSR